MFMPTMETGADPEHFPPLKFNPEDKWWKIQEETLKKTYDEFNRLQDRWKERGMVPAGELNNLRQNYHFLVELFFDLALT